ncbi:MAG: cupin domain-containing protein [Kribbellaceae bacterium]
MSAGRPYGGGPALRRCVAGDPARFAEEYWGQAALLSRAADLPASYDDLLTLDAIDELLSRRGLRTPFLRIAKDGSVVGDKQFTAGGGVGAEVNDQVRDDKVAALFASGHTIVLQGLHRVWPPLIDFATQLNADTGHPVQVNAYVTPPQSQGFAAHYDVHDVFVLQVAGQKHWTIHAPVFADPLRNQPWQDRAEAVARAAQEQPPVIDEVLRPGDALYVPRGFLHSAKALGEVSAHLTVGLHTLTRYHLAEELFALAAQRDELRRALPLGIDPSAPDQLSEHLGEVVTALTSHLDDAAAEAVARRLRRRTWSGNRPDPLGPLAQAATIRDLAPGDVVRWRSGLRHRLVVGAEVRLELPDRVVSLPAATEAAMRVLCEGGEVTVGELPGLDEDGQLELVRRLLTEAVLVAAK